MATTPRTGSRRLRKAARYGLLLLLLYLAAAYLVLPAAWRYHARRHPSFEDVPRITYTGNGIPGDPLNVSLIGTEAEVNRIMRAAGWYPAVALSVRSSVSIAV